MNFELVLTFNIDLNSCCYVLLHDIWLYGWIE